MRKRRKRPIRIIRRRTPKGSYTRLFVGRRTIVGKNSHPFKGHQRVDHYHFGERIKYVRRPKELRGWVDKVER